MPLHCGGQKLMNFSSLEKKLQSLLEIKFYIKSSKLLINGLRLYHIKIL